MKVISKILLFKSAKSKIAIVIFISIISLFLMNRIYNERKKQELDVLLGTNKRIKVQESILEKTEEFARNESCADDPNLIDFVRSLIVKPNGKKLNLTKKHKNNDASYKGASRILDKVLGYKRDGFFIEAGAFDGEHISTTLFFELQRNWTGILIEPIPFHFNSILTKNRNVYALNACISSNDKPSVQEFKVLGVISGNPSEMNSKRLVNFENLKKRQNRMWYTLRVPCFPFYTILKALDIKVIDYFSLDVEGAEMSVLRTIDFNYFRINSFSVEWIENEKAKKEVTQFLQEKEFTFVGENPEDLYFKYVHF